MVSLKELAVLLATIIFQCAPYVSCSAEIEKLGGVLKRLEDINLKCDEPKEIDQLRTNDLLVNVINCDGKRSRADYKITVTSSLFTLYRCFG